MLHAPACSPSSLRTGPNLRDQAVCVDAFLLGGPEVSLLYVSVCDFSNTRLKGKVTLKIKPAGHCDLSGQQVSLEADFKTIFLILFQSYAAFLEKKKDIVM